jgi:hypothetical protein
VVIDDFNIVSIAIFKAETYTPLIVYTDASLSRTIMNQCFEPIFDGGKRRSSMRVAESNCINRIAARLRISGGSRRDLPVAKKRSVSVQENV